MWLIKKLLSQTLCKNTTFWRYANNFVILRQNSTNMSKILVIDDERAIRNTFKEILEFEGYEVDTAENGKEGLQKAEKEHYSLIYSDVKMPEMDGIEFLEKLQEVKGGQESSPIVMISGHGNIETAVEAIKKGAYDFIEKPLDINRLLITTKNAIETGSQKKEIKTLRKKVSSQNKMVGSSAAIARIREMIDKVAPTDARVLVTGENGTGKEIVARLLHEGSNRSGQPLIEVNCAAIPSELIESELFGHVKGSFTGAIKDRAGKFEQADGGTLFLDEIGDMALSTQAKVLRALQEQEITRVGSDKTIHVNVRVIAATNKDLKAEIAAHNFREDLYHRLNVIEIHLPALRERKEDIPELVNYFVEQLSKESSTAPKVFTKSAMKALQEMEWSGNIRELRNYVEKLLILAPETVEGKDVEMYR